MDIVSRLILIIMLLGAPGATAADEIRVATASNFRAAMSSLANQFKRDSGHELVLIFGSTGKHYAQIVHGAPFDVFFAADSERPTRLEKEGLIVPGSRFTYARGQLVLWGLETSASRVDQSTLQKAAFHHLAIANPKLAPYGRAAAETLKSLGLWKSLSSRLVRGENIAQTFQFVMSGNAELGFVAWSQLKPVSGLDSSAYWLVPPGLHQPIEQQAVWLKDNPATRAFMLFIRSNKAITIIREHGYVVP
jgi:molybdate transport system substrate-binding protein